MRKIILLLLLCLFSGAAMAQPGKKIDPPVYTGPSEIDSTRAFYRFYVTADEELYFEDRRLRYWDEVSSFLLAKQRSVLLHPEEDVAILADRNVPFRFIEKLRRNLIGHWDGNIHYMAKGKDNLTALTIYTSGKEFSVKEITQGKYFTQKHGEYIYAKGDKDKEIGLPPPPPYYQKVWGNMLYEEDFENLNSTLSHPKFRYGAIHIVSTDSYIWENEEYSFDDTKKLKDIVASDKHLIFIKVSEEMTYGQYFKIMAAIQEHRKFVPRSISISIRGPHIIEVDKKLEERLLRNGIDIFGKMEK